MTPPLPIPTPRAKMSYYLPLRSRSCCPYLLTPSNFVTSFISDPLTDYTLFSYYYIYCLLAKCCHTLNYFIIFTFLFLKSWTFNKYSTHCKGAQSKSNTAEWAQDFQADKTGFCYVFMCYRLILPVWLSPSVRWFFNIFTEQHSKMTWLFVLF